MGLKNISSYFLILLLFNNLHSQELKKSPQKIAKNFLLSLVSNGNDKTFDLLMSQSQRLIKRQEFDADAQFLSDLKSSFELAETHSSGGESLFLYQDKDHQLGLIISVHERRKKVKGLALGYLPYMSVAPSIDETNRVRTVLGKISVLPKNEQSYNDEKYKAFLNQLCQKGKYSYCYRLAEIFMALKENQQARELFLNSCNKDYGPSCNYLASLIRNEGAKNFIQLYQKGCKANDSKSCYNHAVFSKKSAEKIKSYQKSCSLDFYPPSCHEVGVLLSKKKNKAKAIEFFAKSCQRAYYRSCIQAARFEENIDKAIDFVQKGLKFGFKDKEYLEKTQEFSRFLEKPKQKERYQKLLKSL